MNNTSKKQKWHDDFRQIMGAIHELQDQFPDAEESFRNITALMDTNYDSFIEWMTEGEMDMHYGILDGCYEEGTEYEYTIDSVRGIRVYDNPKLEGDTVIKLLDVGDVIYLKLFDALPYALPFEVGGVAITIDLNTYYISLEKLEEVIL